MWHRLLEITGKFTRVYRRVYSSGSAVYPSKNKAGGLCPKASITEGEIVPAGEPDVSVRVESWWVMDALPELPGAAIL